MTFLRYNAGIHHDRRTKTAQFISTVASNTVTILKVKEKAELQIVYLYVIPSCRYHLI
jgi:hypothetical protein